MSNEDSFSTTVFSNDDSYSSPTSSAPQSARDSIGSRDSGSKLSSWGTTVFVEDDENDSKTGSTVVVVTPDPSPRSPRVLGRSAKLERSREVVGKSGRSGYKTAGKF